MINIVTKGPELGACAGKGSLSYGNYDYWRVDGMINAPLGDKAAVRLDGAWQQRDGFIDHATDGETDINDRDRCLVNGPLLLQPTETITLLLIPASSQREETCGCGVLLHPVHRMTTGPDDLPVASPNTP